MTAVDAPPRVSFAGRASGEFTSRPGPRRLAWLGFLYSLVVGMVTISMAARHPFRPGAEFAMVLPMVCISVTGIALAVRRARLRFDAQGIRWGWELGGFRIDRARLMEVIAYSDAIAVRAGRRSSWYLAARDWNHFDDVVRALAKAELPHAVRSGRAPFRARLQSYGGVLDLLVVLACLFATLLALFASGL